MARALKRLKVKPGSEIAKLLDAASTEPVLLERDGELYRLFREEGKEDIWADYDPENVREALNRTAGSWADIDADAMISDLYRAREEGSRPDTRP